MSKKSRTFASCFVQTLTNERVFGERRTGTEDAQDRL